MVPDASQLPTGHFSEDYLCRFDAPVPKVADWAADVIDGAS